MQIAFWAIFVLLTVTVRSENILDGTACDNAVSCLSDTTYSFCFLMNNGQDEILVGNFSCGSGYKCIEGLDNPCHKALISQQKKNYTSDSLVASCENNGVCKQAASNCNQYYELTLQTCASGESFSSSDLKCVADTSCSVTTQPSADDDCACTPPEVCIEANKYPSKNCNQYYECVATGDGYELVVQNCPSGQGFNRTQLACIDGEVCEKYQSSTTPTNIVVTPPTCTEPGRLPCQECNQYYECRENKDGSFEISLETCSSGHAYDNSKQECIPDDSCVPAATETTTTEVVTPPTCIEPGRLPCQECNQYYECRENKDGSFEISLETCPSGQAYDNSKQDCLPDDTCIPASTETTAPEVVTPPTCTEPGRLPCQECNQYYECRENKDGSFEISLETCPSGQAYDNSKQDCIPDDSCVPAPTETTTTEVVTPPTCTEPGRLPCQECNQYYECRENKDGSFEISLETCPSGQAYDNSKQDCLPDDTCIPASTETTAPEVVTPPTCTEPGRLPCQECNQYYECKANKDGSFEISLETCPSGQAYDNSKQDCIPDDSCIPAPTETTTTEVVTPPTCIEPGRLPCQECNQYYECRGNKDGSFEISLETCPSGHAYDNSKQDCIPDDTCIPASTETTAPEVVTPPTCTEPGRLPCQECNQYYECRANKDGSFEISLETCPSGQAYDNSKQDCIPDDSCIPAPTETTTTEVVTPPTCTEPGRLPCQECNQYYECRENKDGSFEISLETCPSGQAYDNSKQDCVADDTCIPETITEITTTTEISFTPPAECTFANKYPSPNCHQFYECVQFLWWYNLHLYTCPQGEAYSIVEQICVVNSSCNSKTGKFETPEPPETSTPSFASTTLASTASSVGSTTSSDSASPETSTGITSSSSISATTSSSTTEALTTTSTPLTTTISSSTTTAATVAPTTTATPTTTPSPTTTTTTTPAPTTTPTTTTTTTTTTTPAPTTTPTTTTTATPCKSNGTAPSSCSGPGKYPGSQCNQYYECVEVMYWYELVIQTCAAGYSYSSCLKICVIDASCNP